MLVLVFMLGLVTLLIKQLRQPETADRLGHLFAMAAPREPAEPVERPRNVLPDESAASPPARPLDHSRAMIIVAAAAVIAAALVSWALRQTNRPRALTPLRLASDNQPPDDETTRRRLAELANSESDA